MAQFFKNVINFQIWQKQLSHLVTLVVTKVKVTEKDHSVLRKSESDHMSSIDLFNGEVIIIVGRRRHG